MSRTALFLKILLPLLILALGAAGMAALIKSRQPPAREAPETLGALVDILEVRRGDHQVRIHATGTVRPRHEVSITPQVSGLVVDIAPGMLAGGRLAKGEELFAVEDVDYRLAVERAQAALARAELDLRTVEGQARVARAEWQRLDLDGQEEPNPLVLFEPQLANAKAGLAAARAQLEQARLDLARTRLRAPFNALVRNAQVEMGQYLRAGNPVATLIGTDRAEVIVPLPLEDLALVRVPRPGANQQGSPAAIHLTFGERGFAWQGQVVRSLGEVDERGRMARIVVAVEDPYNLRGTWPANHPALEMGSFVQVEILGDTLPQVVSIPRTALREGDEVWIAAEDDSLRIRAVDVLRREQHSLLIGAGLEEGERLVLTHLMGAAEGMKLRPRAPEDTRP
ncbi:efflux RND transporter periplasmic adaptor subunit [Geoalkalibacter sp.]|uniref:efflux RND transporter periplasmic adaptor subunit n=1 Tax=Geoalkalibacter sp. TaxID=3041440 RepID=UPI00272DF73E|nr:efflux RND transporter periplasmic adaptor subunit [Geoalkalibacter sp.]